MFAHAVPVRGGEVVTREGFVFADLAPDEGAGRDAFVSGTT